MKVISFLRSFTATRVIKGKFRLSYRDGGGAHGFAFGQRQSRFEAGQQTAVRSIKGSMLVVTGDAFIGEAVLDGAKEGLDFEVVSNAVLLEAA
ncbi:MAG: hypothetical protein ACO1TE_19815 [Prosthecobacter sp.]